MELGFSSTSSFSILGVGQVLLACNKDATGGEGAFPAGNGDSIGGRHSCQATVSSGPKSPGLGEAGTTWSEKEAGQQAKEPQQKIPATSERE